MWYSCYILSNTHSMSRTTDLLTISIKAPLLRKIRTEAKRQKTGVSALLRDAFLLYMQETPEVYTQQELKRLLKADELPVALKRQLDKKLA